VGTASEQPTHFAYIVQRTKFLITRRHDVSGNWAYLRLQVRGEGDTYCVRSLGSSYPCPVIEAGTF
jgi:hypothetical protein